MDGAALSSRALQLPQGRDQELRVGPSNWNQVRAAKALYPETFPAAASIEWSFQEAAPVRTLWLLKTPTPALLQR